MNMFGVTRYALIAGLERSRRHICCYGTRAERCDCKYGGGEPKAGDEKSGCPEMRSVILLLQNMTDEQYMELCKRARIEVWK
jgi:hypothetical protein